MIGVGPPDTFIYPRRNRLEMPGTAPELLRSGETTPITLSVWVLDLYYMLLLGRIAVLRGCGLLLLTE